MEILNFVMALTPILFVLVGILCFKQPAKRVAPLALVWTLILAFTYFNVTGATFAENVAAFDPLVWKGVKEGFKIVLMVFGAFVILNLLRETGAIEDVKATIARISDDRRVQVIVIGMMMPIFLEGAAGAGAPAAIAAPFLVALGFDPVTAVAIALLGDATPASWGGAGLTTINGGAALVDAGLATVAQNAAMVGRFHMFGVLIIPFIMTFMAFGKKGFKGAVPYLTFAGVSTCLVMFALSNFVGAEVTSMGTGLISMLLSVAYVRVVGIKTPEEYRNRSENTVRHYSSFRAMSPYIYMLVLLPVIRYGFPAVVKNGFAIMCTFGYIVWVDVVILLCGVLGALTLKVRSKTYFDVCRRTISNVAPVDDHHGQPPDRCVHHAVVQHRHDESACNGHRQGRRALLSGSGGAHRLERRVHHRHGAWLEHHVRTDAHRRRRVARHEPHHHLCRSERGRVARQPHLPEQHRRRLRNGR